MQNQKNEQELAEILARLTPEIGRRYEKDGVVYTAMLPALDEALCEPVIVFSRVAGEVNRFTLLVPVERWGQAFELPDMKTEFWDKRPKPGETWRHYKGTDYEVAANAHHVDGGAHYVIYKSKHNSLVWARPARSWFEKVPRFAPVV